MSEILLKGLVGSHPLGALAAFGLLRCCEEMEDFRGSRLGWRRGPDWHAVLETTRPAEPGSLVTALVERQKRRPAAPELNWADNIKTKVESYRGALRSVVEAPRQEKSPVPDFLASFGCELLVDGEGRLVPTAFYMTSGRQQFLKEVRTLGRNLVKGIRVNRRRKDCGEMFSEALFNPWRYEDPVHSLGWDPCTERLHALLAAAPEDEKNSGVSAAVWLAFEALPLFPCFLSEGRLATTGFQGGSSAFTWPLWEGPIGLATVRSLLSLEELTRDEPPKRELRARGVEAVFRSERYRVKTKGSYFIFRPAFPCL